MKNRILKGLCLFFILTTLFLLSVPVIAEAQSGHGGTTEVTARIEPPSEHSPDETQPFTEPVEPPDDSPAGTGRSIVWLTLALLSMLIAVMLILWLRRGQNKA